MIGTLVKKELSANLLTSRFVLIFLLCSTLILVSAYTMREKYAKRVDEYRAAVKAHKDEFADLEGVEGLTKSMIGGYKLDKPPAPLSVIAEGMEGAAGKFASINNLATPMLEGGSGGDPMFAYFGTLDMMYIVRVVLSLVAILLTYDAISGEREQGTLKLVLSNSVPRHAVLLSKCIGGYVTLILPFLIPTLIGLLILITSGNIEFSGNDWARLGLILLASLLYIGVFLMLGLLVSSRTSKSTTALMLLLFIWVVIVLAVPKVSMIAAGKLRDVPSVQRIQSDKDAVIDEVTVKAAREREEYVKKFREEMRANRPENPQEAISKMYGEIAGIQERATLEISRRNKEIQADYDTKKAAQFRLAAYISRVSPASTYTYSATGLAHTNFSRQERFLDMARAYKGIFMDRSNAFMKKVMEEEIARAMAQERGDTVSSEKEKFNLEKEAPPPEFVDADLAESWNSVWGDFMILFLLVACFFMIAYLGFVRSDVR